MKGLALAIICVLPNLIYSLGFPQTKNLIPAYQAISTPDFGYLPTYVARAKGFFTDERLDLKVIVVNSRVSVPALIANEVHFGVAGPSITASLRGAPLKAIYFIYNTSTFQFTVRPEIRTPDNLKGKTVAISSPGATNDLATRLILAKLGLDPVRDVKFIAIGDAKARVIAMDQGQVAAAANNPDIAAELVRKGYRILMHSGEVFPVPFSGTAVNQKLIRENPDLIKRWLRAHLKAMLLIRQRPEEAAQIAAKDLKINPEVAREATSQVLQFMYPDDPGGFTENGMRVYLQQTAPRLGVDPDKVAISQIADMSFLREVQREMGIHLANGDVLSAGDSMGWHVACAGFAVKRIIERFENNGGINADDIFLLNDPYLAAIHQSDVYMISPIHFKGQLIGWSATFVHVMDIGAMSPGGNSPGATEICHEGIRIPGIKLVDRGELRKDLFDAFINMTRQPVMVGLDLKCEIAANNVAKARMQSLYEQFGPELVSGVSQEMVRYSEAILRKRIAEIPDGTWGDTGSIHAGDTWKVHVKLNKKDDRLLFDFTGSSPQAKKGINLPYHATFGACYEAILCTLAYDLPKNHGALKPIEVIAPQGTVVNPTPPAPVSLNTTSGGATVKFVANSAIMQMLATSEKWREEVMALNAGHRLARHAGVNQHGKYYVSTLSEGALDGTGARSYKDGDDTGRGLSCHNIEWLEANFPLLYLFRRNTKGGAGAGRYRGGTGGESALTVHDAPEGKIKGVALGVVGLRNSGQGMFGGYPGAPSLLMLKEGTRVAEMMAEEKLPDRLDDVGGTGRLLPYCEFDVGKNDVLYMRMSSGGGYGDPLEREPERVLNDVENRIVSRDEAKEIYGIVLKGEDLVIDLAATERQRASLRQARLQESK